MTLLIKNGTVVNAAETLEADVLIENGKIIKVSPQIEEHDGYSVIDAKGKYLFPGGIDPHVHMHLPTAAGYSSDDFVSGSIAAIYGGTTTLIDFVTPRKGENLCEALEQRKKEAEGAFTDYSFHVSPVEWRPSLPGEIKRCVENEGITSFKVYMAYKDTIGLEDDDLLRVMKAVAGAGGMVTVHCEDGDRIEALRNRFFDEGKTTPLYHPLSRPPEAEAVAVKKAVDFAARTGCPLYIVHVSSRLSLPYIREAQERGEPVFAETCPQYLLLDDSKYEAPFEKSAPFVMSPPLRKKEDRNDLWNALADNLLQTVGTDHCPFTMEQKRKGIHDFRKIANGAGGVEHRLALLYTFGVLEKRFSINRFVEITSTNAAKIFGLYPKKGVIGPGADADITVWNPKVQHIISSASHHMICENDIFEGFQVRGAPEYVIKSGKIVLTPEGIQEKNLHGFFLPRNVIKL